ncbi:HD domain-containing protein [Halalkalicoccus subterraneus]|uniref:HD domain-containing protein n=1 Tax=Halalkalicoccus subterraneus TaxID=2675002 RepID=UPI000EFC7F11|nr:HD domain-containing protein [Halalkalicoccus subterraneus]
MGVEIKETPVSEAEFDEMKRFVYEYLDASVQNEEEGGRMRWYPWHSAEYRFNHTLNVLSLAEEIARKEGADVDVVRVAALFHDVAKLDADQEVHAEEGARVAREYLGSRGSFPTSFIDRVCRAIDAHTHSGDIAELSLEGRCLIEADLLDKVGANGTVLMLLRMGYEARTHMDSATMIDRVYERGQEACERIQSPTAETIAHERLKRVRWFCEWLESEVPEMERGPEALE